MRDSLRKILWERNRPHKPSLTSCFCCLFFALFCSFIYVHSARAEVCFLPDDQGCSIVPVIQEECTGSDCDVPTPTCDKDDCFSSRISAENYRTINGYDSYYYDGSYCYCPKKSCSGDSYMDKPSGEGWICTGLCEDKKSLNYGKYKTCTGGDDDLCCESGYSTKKPTITQHCYATKESTLCDKTCYKILNDPDCENGELLSYDNNGGCTCVGDYVFTFADGTTENKSKSLLIPGDLDTGGTCETDIISKRGDEQVEFSVVASGRTLVGTLGLYGDYENVDQLPLMWNSDYFGVWFNNGGDNWSTAFIHGKETYTLVQKGSGKTLTITCKGECDHEANYTELGNQCACKESYKEKIVDEKYICYCDTESGFIEKDGKCICDTERHFVDKDGTCVCDESKNFELKNGECVCKDGYEPSADKKSCEFGAKCDTGLTIEDDCHKEEHYLYTLNLFYKVNTIKSGGVEKKCGYCIRCNSVFPPVVSFNTPEDVKQCWEQNGIGNVCNGKGGGAASFATEYTPKVTADSTFYSCGIFGGLFNSPEPCNRFGSGVDKVRLKQSWKGVHDGYKVSGALSDYEYVDYPGREVKPFTAYYLKDYFKDKKLNQVWSTLSTSPDSYECIYIDPNEGLPAVHRGENVIIDGLSDGLDHLYRGINYYSTPIHGGNCKLNYQAFLYPGTCETGTSKTLTPYTFFTSSLSEGDDPNKFECYAIPPVPSGYYKDYERGFEYSSYWDWNFEKCPLKINNEYVTCLTAEYVIDDDPSYSVRNHSEGQKKITVVGDTSFIDVEQESGSFTRYFKYFKTLSPRAVSIGSTAEPSSSSSFVYESGYEPDVSYKAYDEFLRHDKHIAAPGKVGAAIRRAEAKYVIGNIFIPTTGDQSETITADDTDNPTNTTKGYCRIGLCPSGSVMENSCGGTFTPNGAYLLPEGARGYTDNVLDLIPCGTCTEGCDESNHFIEDSNGGCVCDAANHYVIQQDGTCGCESHYVANEDGNCVCDAENHYEVQQDGSCGCESHYVADEDGNCVCDTKNHFVTNADGSCSCDEGYEQNSAGSCVEITGD